MKFSDFLIRTKEELEEAIETFQILPLFSNTIPGFSIEEHVHPDAWFSSSEGVWEWKGPVIQETGCAYGKFFEHKAAFISRTIFPDFANYRRGGKEFETRCDEGLISYKDKYLYELVEGSAPVISRYLKILGGYGKGGRVGFETSINHLQAQCYVLISDFVYETDRYGKEYGWGVAEYSTPELFMGDDFTSTVYEKLPQESYETVLEQMRKLLPGVDDEKIRRFLK